MHVQQVEEDKLKDREGFKNKRAKTTSNEFRQQKSSTNMYSFQQIHNISEPSSTTASAPRNKAECNG